MSETEKKRRASYRRRRRITLVTIAALLAIVTLITAALGFGLYQSNKTLYIDYTEEGEVDYTVALKPNDFYGSATLPAGRSYIASLIDGVTATFNYTLQTEAQGVSYEYAYWLDTQLIITDKGTKAAIYNPTFPVKDKQIATQSAGTQLVISENATLDYTYYNEIAESFIKKYDLSNVESNLVARMHVSVLSLCDEFRSAEQSEYVVTLSIPLTTKTVNVEMSSTVPSTESKILACENNFNRDLFVGAITHSAITDAALLVLFVLVALFTRNKDITYAIKVKKLVASYRSFIQQIKNPFNTASYQILYISAFNEMLEIRDTINSPILMYENADKTCTQFIIPTSINLLYIYELKVADYDEIYDTAEKEVVPAAQAPVIEQEILAQAPMLEEPATVALSAEIPSEAENSVNSSYDFGVKYDYSFEARLALADDEVKDYYRKIVAFARCYGVKVSRSWARERIYLGRSLFALITFKGKKLALAFAKDPATAEGKHHAIDVSALKKFERTPMLMRITSTRKTSLAIELLNELFANAGLTDKKLNIKVDYADHRTKPDLLAAGLIKIKGAPTLTPTVSVAEKNEPTVEHQALGEEDFSGEANGNAFNFGVRHNYSFEARLALADDEVKDYYRKIVAFARCYGVKVSRSWARERIYLGRSLFALITFKGKKLALAFAKDPATAEGKHHAIDVSALKKFERTPMLMRITSTRKTNLAIELLSELFASAGLADKKLNIEVDCADHRTKSQLLADGLIRTES